jgi:3-oxoacyl-[acyl-carrier protein] reductase
VKGQQVGTLEGKVALVSGSGRGIGRAVVEKFAAEGAKVVVNDIDKDVAEEVGADLRGAGADVAVCVGSVTDVDFGDRFVQTALDSFGRIDIIVNNAGYTWDNVLQKTTDEQWYAMLDVHLTAPFRIMRAATDYIRSSAKAEAAAGTPVVRKIVNVSSISGVLGNAGQIGYAAGKAGINGMTKTMAKEWGRYQVTVNSVGFGLIKTRLTEAPADAQGTIEIQGREIKVGVNPELLASLEPSIPMGRAGTPRDGAGAIYLLCIPESDYITGQVLLCTGGAPI